MAIRRSKNEQVQKIIIFSHILMKNSPIFFKFSQELYYIMLKQNPVTVCPKSALVHIQKSKRWLLVRLFWASPENHKSKQWPSPENSPIFFKFSQELYYMMLKQISVTVCHNLWPSHYSKILSKWFHQFRSVCGQPPSYSFYCIELNHQIALHGNIIAHFELWTEHSEYLKKSFSFSLDLLIYCAHAYRTRNITGYHISRNIRYKHKRAHTKIRDVCPIS